MAAPSSAPFQPTDEFRLNRYGDPRLSPDGHHVAVTVTSVDTTTDEYVHSVHVLPCPTKADSAPMLRRRGHGGRWSPDGSRLAVAIDDDDAAIVVIEIGTGLEAQLRLPGSCSELAWSPDGGRLAVARMPSIPRALSPTEAHRPRILESIPYRQDGIGFLDRASVITVLDVATGVWRDATDGAHHSTSPAWSPNGEELAYVADQGANPSRPHRGDIWVVNLANGQRRRITDETGNVSSPQFSPDGRFIAYLGHSHGNRGWDRHRRLWVASARGATRAYRLDQSCDVEAGSQVPSGQQLRWLDDSAEVLFLAAESGCCGLRRANRTSVPVVTVTSHDEQIDGFDASNDGRTTVYTAQWPDGVSKLYLLQDGRRQRLRTDNDETEISLRFAALQRRSWSIGDHCVDGFIVAPTATDVEPPYPLVLDIHGGPHAYHPYPVTPTHVQSLAAAGFAVVLANPRGSGGRDEAWRRAITGRWGSVDLDDLLAVVDALVQDGTADPKALFVYGASYGGYLTALATARDQRFKAAAMGAMISDLVSAAGTSDVPDYFAHEIGELYQGDAAHRRASPLWAVRQVSAPTLILHWEGDLRCPIGQSDQWFTALRRHGTRAVLVRYPGGSHDDRTPSQYVDRISRVVEWFTTKGSSAEARGGPMP
jgi:dipeptidyl aminopeptidase/acylaminoacyl peptidase